ncbi:MAG: MarR family transcriptional regulator [Rhizobiaceae bacterium]|nr:MarR family transcriptional regulator [Rhizobiaceae bacterium]
MSPVSSVTPRRRRPRPAASEVSDFYGLIQAGREGVLDQFRGMLAAWALTEQQWRTLKAIEVAGAIHMAELQRATHQTEPALSRMLRQLEAKELVQRRRVRDGLGRFVVELAPAGQTVMALANPHCETAYRRIVDAYGRDRLKQLDGLLRQFDSALRQASR